MFAKKLTTVCVASLLAGGLGGKAFAGDAREVKHTESKAKAVKQQEVRQTECKTAAAHAVVVCGGAVVGAAATPPPASVAVAAAAAVVCADEAQKTAKACDGSADAPAKDDSATKTESSSNGETQEKQGQ